VSCVLPSTNDDVITSPYNSILALSQLIDHAHCVIPFENQALFDLTAKHEYRKLANPFDAVNDLVGRALTDLTCSMRFNGSLNIGSIFALD
jgi:tubulin epsilon